MWVKGFTLIELLAVIVILAIIALMATPIVLNIIRDSKENTRLRSAKMYLSALETSIATLTLNKKEISNGTYNILENGNICIEYSENKCINELKVEVHGEVPSSGKITVSNGKIVDKILNYNNKAIVNNNNELIYSYKESNNMEVPDLYNNTLIPVIYDGNNWVIADVTKKWYDYSKQEWANAVILNSNVDKDIGDTITVDGDNPDTLAMLVWIPRYEYKIDGTYGKGGTSATSPGEIEVNFISASKKVATTDYRIHPAFNFGGTDISGIWVGKFELSHSDSTNSKTSLGCADENCNSANNLRVLPDVKALGNNSVSSFFYGIRSMSKSGNIFGIDSSITDTHMIKNSEWGAVAYLSQSKYGKYGNDDYSGLDKEVYVNISTGIYTGRSGGSYGTNTVINTVYEEAGDNSIRFNTYGYYTYDGYLLLYNTNTKTNRRYMTKIASTTGNIYGIYDMSGGSWEYTMGIFANPEGAKWTGNSSTANSGFKGKVGTDGTDIEGLEWPDKKYYDIYISNNEHTIEETTTCNGGICYGHALSETKWYRDSYGLVSTLSPWFVRGACYDNANNIGIFASSPKQGNSFPSQSTRVVFTPTT